jgi:hypothetical protein
MACISLSLSVISCGVTACKCRLISLLPHNRYAEQNLPEGSVTELREIFFMRVCNRST